MKLHSVEHARREHICAKCHGVISVGSSYYWWKPIGGRRVKWHAEHGVPPRSILCDSPMKSPVYYIQEHLFDYCSRIKANIIADHPTRLVAKGKIDYLYHRLMLDDILQIDRAISQCDITANRIEEHFGETAQVVQLRVQAYEIDRWWGAVEAAARRLVELMDSKQNGERYKKEVLGLLSDLMEEIEGLVL